MSFEIDSKFVGARDELVRSCREMEERLGRLLDAEADAAQEVHEVRKRGKELRGALTMAREAKPCIRWVAVIGRMLGESRDSVVRHETWQALGLEEAAPGSIEWVIEALLLREAEGAARRPPPEVVEWGLSALGQIRGRVENVADAEWRERCGHGSRQMLRRLRRRLKRAASEAEDRDFHEARKAVKAWLGGARILLGAESPAATPVLEALADQLGEEHDLEVLGQWLCDRGFTPATAPRVWKRLPKLQIRARRGSLAMIRREVLPVLKEALQEPVSEPSSAGGDCSRRS